ncbi:hypothetical protein KXD93_25115 [Mucilaginibacter sp. BJC16-A38]|uniref:hypothetical protein n=1 Tax=Mucilaginibacter phenanthrenivorans TaxID=1234842 RepID=UPI0021578659|nr:hypothetical protein [Mucilaginibacter phenanthrenivorans]MCR8560963.1 hypothetical protein [Mucilaginibacter phenanthrenivorans]
MGLFDFFKKEKKLNFDINSSSLTELLDNGILFEDNSKFLQWGKTIKDLSKVVEVKEKLFADRTVYQWGERNILKGLALNLTTTYWNHREDSVDKRFNSINFSISGDEAIKYFDLIKIHLQKELGEARKEDNSGTQRTLDWLLNETRLRLYFFEQHTYKLNFEITRL